MMIATPTIAKVDFLSITNSPITDLTHFAMMVVRPATTKAALLITAPSIPDLAITQSAVLDWANQLAIAGYTYDFAHYKEEFQSLSNYFTPDGWKQFYNALEKSNNLEVVIAKKLKVTAVVTKTPIILQQGILNGRYSWRVQTFLLATYQNDKEYTQQTLEVIILIARTSPIEGTNSLRVIQFIAR